MKNTDATLVMLAQGGDRGAFEELVRRSSRLVYARLFLATHDRHRTEDLLQETLLRAYRSLDRLREPNHWRAWLFIIAQNVLTDQTRKDARAKIVGDGALDDAPGNDPPPEETAGHNELRIRLLTVLEELPDEYQMPLSLRYLAGADYATIETQLGLTNGKLRGLLHRGLKLLRERLKEPRTQ